MTELDAHALAVEVAELVAAQQAPPRLMTADQAGDMLAVPSSWLLAEARADRVPHVRLGKYVRFRASELEEWLDRRAQGVRR